MHRIMTGICTSLLVPIEEKAARQDAGMLQLLKPRPGVKLYTDIETKQMRNEMITNLNFIVKWANRVR